MKRFILFSFIAPFLFILSCQKKDSPVETNFQKDFGQLELKLDMTNAPANVVALKGYLESTQDTIYFDFEIIDNYAIAKVEDIPVGYWRLTVDAYNSEGVIIYSGSTLVYVIGGETTPVYLELNPATGSLRIIVTWGGKRPDIIAYFPFDGNFVDQSIFHNDAKQYGDVEFAEGKFGQAANFDGIDDFLEIKHMDIYNLDEKTIAFWFYKNNDSIRITPGEPADIEEMVMKGPNTSLALDFSFHIGTPDPPFNVNLLFTDLSISNQILLREFDVINPKQWYFIAGVFMQHSVKFYLNGEKILEAKNVGQYNHNKYSIFVGGPEPSGNSPTRFFNGKIDELVIFSAALNDEQIHKLYQTGVQE